MYGVERHQNVELLKKLALPTPRNTRSPTSIDYGCFFFKGNPRGNPKVPKPATTRRRIPACCETARSSYNRAGIEAPGRRIKRRWFVAAVRSVL